MLLLQSNFKLKFTIHVVYHLLHLWWETHHLSWARNIAIFQFFSPLLSFETVGWYSSKMKELQSVDSFVYFLSSEYLSPDLSMTWWNIPYIHIHWLYQLWKFAKAGKNNWYPAQSTHNAQNFIPIFLTTNICELYDHFPKVVSNVPQKGQKFSPYVIFQCFKCKWCFDDNCI